MAPRTQTPSAPARPEAAEVTGGRLFRRRRRARRWLVWRRVLLAIVLVGGLGLGLWLVFFSSVLSVTGAEVRGTDRLTPAKVEAVADVPLGVPLATANLAAVRARVEALPEVASAEVSRSWPHDVRIDVTEREPVAVVSWEGSWRALDSEGVLFGTFDSPPKDLLTVTMRADTPSEALAEAAAVVESLPADLAARVRSVDVTSIDGITLWLRRGAQVRWGSAEQSEQKAEVLRLLLERPAQVYDVTAPGRPTLRG